MIFRELSSVVTRSCIETYFGGSAFFSFLYEQPVLLLLLAWLMMVSIDEFPVPLKVIPFGLMVSLVIYVYATRAVLYLTTI